MIRANLNKILQLLIILFGCLFFSSSSLSALESDSEIFYHFDIIPITDHNVHVVSEELIFDFRHYDFKVSQPSCIINANYKMLNSDATKTIKVGFPFISSFDRVTQNQNHISIKANNEDIAYELAYGVRYSELDITNLNLINPYSYIYHEDLKFPDDLKGFIYKLNFDSGDYNIRVSYNNQKQDKIVFHTYQELTSQTPAVFYLDAKNVLNEYEFFINRDVNLILSQGEYTKEEISFNDYVEYIYQKDNRNYIPKDLYYRYFYHFLESDAIFTNRYLFQKEYNEERLMMYLFDLNMRGNNNINDVIISYEAYPSYAKTSYNYKYLPLTDSWNSFGEMKVKIFLNLEAPYLRDANLSLSKIDDLHYEAQYLLTDSYITFSIASEPLTKISDLEIKIGLIILGAEIIVIFGAILAFTGAKKRKKMKRI